MAGAVVKSAAKAVAKPAVKAVAKKAPRPVVKAAAKPVAKSRTAGKAAAKPAPKALAKKPAAQVAHKPVKTAAKKAATPTPQKKIPSSKLLKASIQASASAGPKVAKPAEKTPVKAVAARPVTPAVVAAPVARAPRVSARLAQLTVPSMAPAVASTAAKSSYLHTMSSPVLAPPPFVAVKKDPKLANNWKTKAIDQLVDAEVLAMPDSEYMNDTQMAFFRLKLLQLKQDILNSAGETTEHLREDTVIVPDPADRATIEEEHALELRTRDRERKLLKKIEQSIARIDAGDYGYCDETGEPIGVGRLLARPTATLSLEAQQRRELKQKMFGD
ncbi:MAG: RNA polymerase-binding protein DksA [Burkholderiaceae bacterium]